MMVVKRALICLLAVIMAFSFILPCALAEENAAGRAMYENGMEAFEKGNYSTAFANFQIAGEVKGYVPAMNMLGVCFRDGLGTERDIEEAKRCFTLAADQGDQEAAANLIAMEASDFSNKEDAYQAAVKLYFEGSFEEAKLIFEALGDYEFSERFLSSISEAGNTESDEDNSQDSQLQAQNEEEAEWVLLYQAYYSSGELRGETGTVYNEDGKVSERYSHNFDNGTELFEFEKNLFDRNGEITGAEIYDAQTGMLTGREIWSYDREDRLEQIMTVDEDGILEQIQKNSYSENENTIEIIEYDDNEEVRYRSLIVDDSDGNPLRYESYNEYGELTYSRETFYGTDGLRSEERSRYYGYYGGSENVTSFEYDENGYLIRTVQRDDSGEESSVTEYSYDEYGNELEDIFLWDGEESGRTVSSWGLLQNGEIIKISEDPDNGFLSGGGKPEDVISGAFKTSSNPTVRKVSKGKISLEETELMDYEGIKVTAIGYSADGNDEAIRIMIGNNRDAGISLELASLKINNRTVTTSFYGDTRAHAERKEELQISRGILEAAGIKKIETVSIALKVKDSDSYEEIYTSPEVTIRVNDGRTRAPALIPIQKAIISEEKLRVELIGYEKLDYSIRLYYSIDNLSDTSFRMESTSSFLNDFVGSGYEIWTKSEANSSVVYTDDFYLSSYGPIDTLETMGFGLELESPEYRTFAEADRIEMKFEPGGKLSSLEGSVSIDRTSEFWKQHFA